jgi:hypothetical protein
MLDWADKIEVFFRFYFRDYHCKILDIVILTI